MKDNTNLVNQLEGLVTALQSEGAPPQKGTGGATGTHGIPLLDPNAASMDADLRSAEASASAAATGTHQIP